jgi:hypothetical protein
LVSWPQKQAQPQSGKFSLPTSPFHHDSKPYVHRGQYYGLAAAFGKIGAFSGSYALNAIQKNAGANKLKAGQDPFWVASTMALFAAALAWFCLPTIGQDTIDEEDIKFRVYLEENGYDTSKMGLQVPGSQEGLVEEQKVTT